MARNNPPCWPRYIYGGYRSLRRLGLLPEKLMPKSRQSKAAELEGVALNQLINVAVAEKVSALRTEEYFQERGRRANRAETISYFSATCAAGQALRRNFSARDRANLRYKKRCTFGFISLEHLPHGNLRFKDGNPNSRMTSFCTIEYGSGNTERRCGRAAVAECGHCGASVCSSCAKECCAQVLCGYCYDYHVIHSCLRSAPPTEF